MRPLPRPRRLFPAVVLAAAAIGLVIPAASAVTVTYAGSSTPQSVNSYGSTGRSYGTWVGYDRTADTIYTGLQAHFKFVDADNHKVYTQFALSATNRSTGVNLKIGDDSSHESVVSSSWRAFTSPAQRMEAMKTAGTTDARATVHTCLDVPWRGDPCSTVKVIETTF